MHSLLNFRFFLRLQITGMLIVEHDFAFSHAWQNVAKIEGTIPQFVVLSTDRSKRLCSKRSKFTFLSSYLLLGSRLTFFLVTVLFESTNSIGYTILSQYLPGLNTVS